MAQAPPASSALRSDLDGWLRLSADDRHQSRTSIPNPSLLLIPLSPLPRLRCPADPAGSSDGHAGNIVGRWRCRFFRDESLGRQLFTRKSTPPLTALKLTPLSPNRRYPSLLFFVASS
ncbi:hypothetical protein B296_00027422 [Ensete ventricosum]|uniref:Uncharacterized protein n=1 Tax=Ensete ventricosum TaxID=4639 RepID=A0A426ZD38_ENSVE|nr:hypothetical protein B296_00027422 [Ensete ventricosum]